MRDRAMHRLSITEAHLAVRKNLYISAQGRAKAGTRQLIEVSVCVMAGAATGSAVLQDA